MVDILERSSTPPVLSELLIRAMDGEGEALILVTTVAELSMEVAGAVVTVGAVDVIAAVSPVGGVDGTSVDSAGTGIVSSIK